MLTLPPALPWLCRFACYIDGLVQDCSNSIGNAMELLQSYTKPSLYCWAIYLKADVTFYRNRR